MRSKTLILSGLLCLCTTPFLSAASVILNEYNGVGSNSRLDMGDGRDSYFGTIFGNGGNWFELLVIDDLDMRGWTMEWHEDNLTANNETATGVLTLSDAALWGDIKRGTIITFIETIDANGELTHNTSTDVSFDPTTNDWWINVATREEATKGDAALVTTVTNNGEIGDFSVGNDEWWMTIHDSQGAIVFGPVGEGAEGWAGPGINTDEGVSLEGPQTGDGMPVTLETWHAVTPMSPDYDDTGSTSFGQLNQDFDPVTQTFTPQQDLSALRGPIDPPVGGGDFDGDGQLTAADIDALTASIIAGGTDLEFDVTGDGAVNESDRQAWVEELKKTYFGDANLDGEFNSGDLVSVLASGTYEADVDSVWESGDFNGDARTNTGDLVHALAGGGYEAGPRAAVAAVPEPAALGLLLVGLLTSVRRLRQNQNR
jgi:hypothetical protein